MGRRRHSGRGDHACLERAATFLLILALLALGFGFLLDRLVTANVRHSEAMRAWPVAAGEVTVSRSSTGTGEDSGAPFVVHYRYEVDGRTYTGRRLNFNVSADGRTVAEIMERYPRGKRVEVRYDPEDPSCCALETTEFGFGDKALIYGVPVLYSAAGLLGALGLLAARRASRHPPAA